MKNRKNKFLALGLGVVLGLSCVFSSYATSADLKDAKKKFVGPNPNILALPQTFKLGAVHLMMKDDVYEGKGAEDCACAAHMHH